MLAAFIWHPVPSYDITNRPSNQADAVTHPNAINNHRMMYFTRQYVRWGHIPTPSYLVAEGTGWLA